MPRLMHIQATDDNGENQDRFVIAHDLAQAKKLWLADVSDNPQGNEVEWIERIRVILDQVSNTPFDGPSRVVDWLDLPIAYERR